MDRNAPLKIVYIGGYGRSGSTILSILLAQDPKTFCLGEMGLFCHNDGFVERSRHLMVDERWAALVKSRAAEPFASEVKSRVRRWMAGSIFALLLPSHMKTATRSRLLKRVRVFDQASGLTLPVLIDASKTARGLAARPFLLADSDEIDIRFIHIEREPSAVIAAITRFRHADHHVNWTWLTGLRASLGWCTANAIAHRFGQMHPDRYLHVRFEDLLNNSKVTLTKIASFTGLNMDSAILDVTSNRSMLVPLMFAGNRLARQPTITLEKMHSNSPTRVSWPARFVLWGFGPGSTVS